MAGRPRTQAGGVVSPPDTPAAAGTRRRRRRRKVAGNQFGMLGTTARGRTLNLEAYLKDVIADGAVMSILPKGTNIAGLTHLAKLRAQDPQYWT